jgi:phytoene synthase
LIERDGRTAFSLGRCCNRHGDGGFGDAGGVGVDLFFPQKDTPTPQTPATAQRTSTKSHARPNRWPAASTRESGIFRAAGANVGFPVVMHSQVITRKSASNLALAFFLLPRAKRDAMSALYAFCREVDDVTDNEFAPAGKRREQLAAWRADIRRACAGKSPQFVVNRELQPVIREYRILFPLFDELLKGCEMDFDLNRYENFEQLELYCYRVASVVGLLSIEIFGYQNPGCRHYAVYLGKALQLTNILRDVKTDARRGRIYLPLEELKKFGVTPEEILRQEYSDRFARLAEVVAERAKGFYRRARQTLPAEDRHTMVAAELMGAVYWRLLHILEQQRFNVFGPEQLKLSRLCKLALILKSWLCYISGLTSAGYGKA